MLKLKDYILGKRVRILGFKRIALDVGPYAYENTLQRNLVTVKKRNVLPLFVAAADTELLMESFSTGS